MKSARPLVFLILISVCVPSAVYSQSYTNGPSVYAIDYSEVPTGVAILQFYFNPPSSPASGNVVLPATISGLPVRQIGGSKAPWQTAGDWHSIFGSVNGTVTSVTIPNGVKTIGDQAFYNCLALTSVSIPNSVERIGSLAFAYSTNLPTVTIPASVTFIDGLAFRWCYNLKSVYFQGDMPATGGGLFDFITNVGTVFYPAGSKGWGTNFHGWPTQPYGTPTPTPSPTPTPTPTPSPTPTPTPSPTPTPTPTPAPTSDSDNDGVNYYREQKDGTDPNNAASFNPLSKSLLAYYPFDGNSGDESGNGFNATNASAVLTADRLSRSQSAFQFNGTNALVHALVNVSETNYSVSFWFRTTSANTGLYSVANAVPPTSAGNDRHIYLNSGNLRARIWNDEIISTTNRNYADGQWHHIVHLFSSGTISQRLYVNGVLAIQGNKSQSDFTGQDRVVFGYSQDASAGATPSDRYLRGDLDDVRIYNRALTESEVEQLFYVEAFSSIQRQFLVSRPWIMGLYSQDQHNANRLQGQTDVTTNPSAFNLFTQAQFDGNRTAGQSDVISNPMFYGLYTSNSIMDLRMGGLMLQRQGNNATVIFQTQTTTDLATQPFTNNGTPISNSVPMPSNKGFLRIQVK